mmetsp:Transcript_24391/g.37620  ORF Transcript_24391/g.37620 Transcript_24391/m.37620 type:complete len:228 (-) Transcript_24391:842-1525(-)
MMIPSTVPRLFQASTMILRDGQTIERIVPSNTGNQRGTGDEVGEKGAPVDVVITQTFFLLLNSVKRGSIRIGRWRRSKTIFFLIIQGGTSSDGDEVNYGNEEAARALSGEKDGFHGVIFRCGEEVGRIEQTGRGDGARHTADHYQSNGQTKELHTGKAHTKDHQGRQKECTGVSTQRWRGQLRQQILIILCCSSNDDDICGSICITLLRKRRIMIMCGPNSQCRCML